MANFRIKLLWTVMLGLSVSVVAAQDAAQLQKLYDDTLVQLQQSQDRKNQLANENAKLTERVADLESQVRTLRSAIDRSEWMSSQYSAFRAFIARYPALLAHFAQYAGSSPSAEKDLPLSPIEFFDRNWPFSAVTGNEGA